MIERFALGLATAIVCVLAGVIVIHDLSGVAERAMWATFNVALALFVASLVVVALREGEGR